jgi:hypothetical protein
MLRSALAGGAVRARMALDDDLQSLRPLRHLAGDVHAGQYGPHAIEQP